MAPYEDDKEELRQLCVQFNLHFEYLQN